MTRAAASFAVVVLSACTGVSAPLALGEPLLVHGAQFRAGALPGSAPIADGELPPDGVPLVAAIETASGIYLAGQLDRTLSGRTSEDAYAVAIRFDGLGSGYFTDVVGPLDPSFPGERQFDLTFDVGSRVPSGLQHLSIVAIDGDGRAGPRRDIEVCVLDGAIPGEISPCDPSTIPPAAAVVLRWDTPADLDLVITTPSGKRVDARHPTTASVTDREPVPADVLADPTIGRFVRDSNAACDADGRNTEALVWNEAPDDGAYLVGVDLFAACSTPGAHFTVSVFRRETRSDGSSALVLAERSTGQLLALQADQGRSAPLYVTYVVFP
jgi:hypothetical protein